LIKSSGNLFEAAGGLRAVVAVRHLFTPFLYDLSKDLTPLDRKKPDTPSGPL